VVRRRRIRRQPHQCKARPRRYRWRPRYPHRLHRLLIPPCRPRRRWPHPPHRRRHGRTLSPR
jgi:hypothetical protein